MNATTKADLDKIAGAIVRAHPGLDAFGQHLSLGLYCLLAEGRPVARKALAQRLGASVDAVNRILENWPTVFSDAEGRVVGYEGLSLPSAYSGRHRITVRGRTLSAWCAWDTLFLPERIGCTAEIASTSPAENCQASLTVAPDRLERAGPQGLHVSFLMPGPDGFKRDVIAAFCHFIHFFPSRQAGETWTAQNPGTFLLSIEEAYALARRVNAARYGDALRDRKPHAMAGTANRVQPETI